MACQEFIILVKELTINYLAAQKAQGGLIRRFGFITTNSITQPFNRVVLGKFIGDEKEPLSVVFAVPDHPWVDSADGAAVRIAMTVSQKGDTTGQLMKVVEEVDSGGDEVAVVLGKFQGAISQNLSIGPDVASAKQLTANSKLSGQGVIVLGDAFILEEDEYQSLLKAEPTARALIKEYRNGSDLVRVSRNLKIIDLHGLSEKELRQFPAIYQRIYTRVRPIRLQMKDKARREKWWLFGRSNQEIRDAIKGLDRYIATCRTAKHRTFLFLDGDVLPDAKIVAIGLDDAYYLGVLSSHVHVTWAIATGAWLGVGNDSNYNHSDCFGKYPFPDPTDAQRGRIRELGEQLDAHRKRQQAQHPRLTLTDMYNVLAKLRAGEALSDADRRVHEQGLVSVLRQLHDELDAAVLAAYGWEDLLDLTGFGKPVRSGSDTSGSDDEILERLVALNADRAAEEARGHIRWLRPEYQAPGDHPLAPPPALPFALPDDEAAPGVAAAQPWPDSLAARAAAVRAALVAFGRPVTAEEVASSFDGKVTDKRLVQVAELLQTLAALGQARSGEDGRWSGE